MEKALIQKLMRIKALADDTGGNVNEKAVAAAMLYSILQEHGMTLDELEAEMNGVPEPTVQVEFSCPKDWDFQLLAQVCCMATGQPQFGFYRLRGKRRVAVDLPTSKVVEVREMYATYRKTLGKHMKKAVDDAYLAFLYANDLFRQKTEDEKKAPRDLSEAEAAAIRRAVKMAREIEATPRPTKKLKA